MKVVKAVLFLAVGVGVGKYWYGTPPENQPQAGPPTTLPPVIPPFTPPPSTKTAGELNITPEFEDVSRKSWGFP